MPWDFIANIGQQQVIGQGKFYWPSGPYAQKSIMTRDSGKQINSIHHNCPFCKSDIKLM